MLKICIVCKNDLDENDFPKNGNGSRNQCKKCCVDRVRLKQLEFTKWSNDLKTECIVCKYNRSKVGIDWHHLDENEKDFEISRFVSSNYPSDKNKEKVLIEMSKCVCLCSNCHREFHAGLIVLV